MAEIITGVLPKIDSGNIVIQLSAVCQVFFFQSLQNLPAYGVRRAFRGNYYIGGPSIEGHPLLVKLPDKPETVRPLEQRPVPVVFDAPRNQPPRGIQP